MLKTGVIIKVRLVKHRGFEEGIEGEVPWIRKAGVVDIVTEIEFVRHARNRLRERLINVEEIKSVLFSPTATYFDLVTEYFVALGPRTSKRGHWLIVVYEIRGDVRRVISVLDTTQAREIAQNREVRGRWLKVR